MNTKTAKCLFLNFLLALVAFGGVQRQVPVETTSTQTLIARLPLQKATAPSQKTTNNFAGRNNSDIPSVQLQMSAGFTTGSGSKTRTPIWPPQHFPTRF
jgi:hypothetical protein